MVIMGLIYSNANDVRAWVGRGTERHLSAFQDIAVADWSEVVQQMRTTSEQGFSREQGFSLVEHLFESISLILSLEYWSRLWIIQEYVLGRCVTVQCGPEVLSGITLGHLADAVGGLSGRFESQTSRLFDSTGLSILHLRVFHDCGDNLTFTPGDYLCVLIIRAYQAGARCSDPHDHVYALLSLHGVARSEIVPDYRKHLLQLFLDVLSFLDRESEVDFKTITIMTRALTMLQERLRLNDCAEASQARLKLIYRLGSIR